ncbi:hypothetical protein [Sphingomonas profundi]|uniref:hypothetical protein n=1 Tax=Alterirhizorhabdus profundi TaxID=2681549 RepID=UPI0012E839B6|nr:hypothetical protein [Sphingomonas profundi]
MSTNATQPDQAEGAREDDRAGEGGGQGVSSQQPAEGADDTPAGDDGSADRAA